MASDLPWDHLPGGTRPSLHQFAEAFNATVADSSLSWPLCIPPIAESQVQALHSFIPTASALGLEITSVSLDSALLNNSPFDAVHWGLTNEPHSEINPANLAFLLHELDQVECPIPPGTALTDTNITAGALWKLGGFSAIGPVGLHSTSLAFGNSASPPGTHDTLRLQGCGAPVHIQPTGHLLLGSENGNSSIHLIIESGASLIVEGPLTVHTGSTLEVEAGGHLEFRGGTLDLRSEATLMTRPHASMAFRESALWSCAEQSAVFLEGDADLDANVHWSVHWSGLVTWSTSQAFAMAGQTGSELHLHALEAGHGWHIGLRTDRSLILMTPEQGGGWNRFESNDAHMRFIQSPLPQLWQGANHFGTWGSHWAQGSLDLACTGSGLDWDISGQSWNWPSGWPQIQGGLYTTSQPPCPVHAIDLSPLETLDCGAGLDRKKG